MVQSPELPDFWERLDAFEGDDYIRMLVPVHVPGGRFTVANLYELRADPGSSP